MAIKTLYGKQEIQEQFIKEANSMTTLNHKHIIQLYGIVLSQPLMLVGRIAVSAYFCWSILVALGFVCSDVLLVFI